MAQITKAEATTAIYLRGGDKDAMFVCNVIQTAHGNSAAMIKGLYNLLKAGHTVRTGNFDIDVLVIDGCRASWNVLNEWEHRTR